MGSDTIVNGITGTEIPPGWGRRSRGLLRSTPARVWTVWERAAFPAVPDVPDTGRHQGLMVVRGQQVDQSLWSRYRKTLETTFSSSDSGQSSVASPRQVTPWALLLSPGKKSGDRDRWAPGPPCPVCTQEACGSLFTPAWVAPHLHPLPTRRRLA